MTVSQLLVNTTSRELAEWQAYFIIQQPEVPDPEKNLKEIYHLIGGK